MPSFKTIALCLAGLTSLALAQITDGPLPPPSPPYSGPTEFQLWAYGRDVNGFPVYGKDGILYAGTLPQTPEAGENITFKVDPSDVTRWLVNGDDTAAMFAIMDSGETEPIQYSDSSRMPANGVDSGWSWMGIQVIHEERDGSLHSQIWAVDVGDDTWELVWNSDNNRLEKAAPVGLRRMPPSRTEPPY